MKTIKILTALGCLVALVAAQGRKPPGPGERRPRPPDQSGSSAEQKFVLAANGFNVEANGEMLPA
jgi:hypothetical protein